jgi:hypothetical protein
MAAVLWDRKGVLMVEFMQQETTITSEVYCETLNKLPRAIQTKSCGMPTSNVVHHHDNAHLHTAAHTQALLECFNWELFDHPPYSPDLAPSNYHLFTHLKNWVELQWFNSNEELMEGVKTWLGSQVVDIFDTSIQKLIPQYDKCLSSVTDYTEKQPKYVRILYV